MRPAPLMTESWAASPAHPASRAAAPASDKEPVSPKSLSERPVLGLQVVSRAQALGGKFES